MPGPTASADLDRALRLLVHDLRAPLSVAQGYLRLLRDGRLADDTERMRALAQSLEALGRISHASDEALAYVALADAVESPAVAVPAADLVARIAAALPDNLCLETTDLASATLHLADAARVVDAVTTVATAVVTRCGRRSAVAMRPEIAGETLQFVIGPPGEWPRSAGEALADFDPWRGGHGLTLPLACRLIRLASGRVLGVPGSHVTVISLPVESPA